MSLVTSSKTLHLVGSHCMSNLQSTSSGHPPQHIMQQKFSGSLSTCFSDWFLLLEVDSKPGK